MKFIFCYLNIIVLAEVFLTGIILAEENDVSVSKKIEKESTEQKSLRKKKKSPKTITVKGMKMPILTKGRFCKPT